MNGIKFRSQNNGIWSNWQEMDKKQITTGVEFETGRIIDGKKEYGKILAIGTIPSATSQTYATGITNFYRYTHISGYTSNVWADIMTHQKINDNSIVLTMEGENIKVTTYTSSLANAGYQGYIELHYLKNE